MLHHVMLVTALWDPLEVLHSLSALVASVSGGEGEGGSPVEAHTRQLERLGAGSLPTAPDSRQLLWPQQALFLHY